jgi:hypothetical protein
MSEEQIKLDRSFIRTSRFSLQIQIGEGLGTRVAVFERRGKKVTRSRHCLRQCNNLLHRFLANEYQLTCDMKIMRKLIMKCCANENSDSVSARASFRDGKGRENVVYLMF